MAFARSRMPVEFDYTCRMRIGVDGRLRLEIVKLLDQHL